MAEVTLQVKVVREQVDKLQKDIDKLRKTTINISAKEATQNLKQAQQALRDMEKTEQEVLKTERERLKNAEQLSRNDAAAAKAEKERAQANAQNARATKDLAKAETEVARQRKETQRAEESAVRTERQRLKLTQDQEKAEKQATAATEEGNEAVKKQGLLYEILGRNLSSFIARMTMYRAVYAGIRAITNGFTEALQTLKAVDDELVTVRKVTGFDQYQMAEVEQQAYAVASKYGTSAADYTSSVAAFARAGYKDLSGDLAELAEKTKIVGDTTADVAQQFLLSVDAAYKYRGNIEQLTAVLDGANEIDNKYATSIEKIAEGMGIVAPVAAQMNVGVDELAASIGTITAVTQRTGTEAARALRAIYLNIVGDTKTEIEEGVTWTTGEIEGLRDVIKLYAKDAYDAAQASGGIIDPMEAIAGLAKSVQDGVLTEAKLMEMVSDIGGKLRTSQLLAIVNNWDMYESMLETYRNAYGSAEAEVENAMDSWTRKAEVLKNTWTEFVKTGLNSSAFKTALDLLTSFVERLGTLPGLLTRIAPLLVGLKLREVAKNMNDGAKAAQNMAQGMKEVGTAASTLNWISAVLIAISAAWNAISYIIEDVKIKHKEAVQNIYDTADAAKDSSDNLLALYADFNSAAEGSDALTESAKKLADALRTDIPEGAEEAGKALRRLTFEQLQTYLGQQYEAVKTAKDELVRSAFEASRSNAITMYSTGDLYEGYRTGNAELESMWAALYGNQNFFKPDELLGEGFLDFSAQSVEDVRAFREELQKIVDKTQELARENDMPELLDGSYYQMARQYIYETDEAFAKLEETISDYDYAEAKSKFLELSSAVKIDTVEAFDAFTKSVEENNEISDEQREIILALAKEYYPQLTEKVNDFAESVRTENEELFKNQKELEKDATATEKAAAAKKDAEAACHKFIDALFDETGQLTEAGKAALKASQYLADLTQAELNARLETAKANYANLRAQLAGVSADALKAAYALIAFESAAAANGIIENREGRDMRDLERTVGYVRTLINQINALEAEINSVSVQATYVAPYTSGYSSSSSGSGSSSGGGSHSSSSTSTEDKKLKSLQDRVTLLKSELSLMKERGDSEQDQIAKMRQIQDALKAEWEYLKSIGADQATINNLMQEWWNIENSVTSMMDQQAEAAQKQAEALQKALDAQIALNNALKDRSVRYYNASTGQWEWGANAENVANARSALESAVASAGMTMDQWGLQYSLMAIPGIKDRWLNGGVPSFNWDASAVNRGGTTNTSVGTNNYGATYNIAGVTLTEAQARSMTVYELAQLSGSLAIQNNSI